MYICQECHTKRQNRKALESQPIQWTGETITNTTTCPDCSKPFRKKAFYQYLNAYELTMELEEAREKIEKLEYRAEFPISFYMSANDLLSYSKSFPHVLNDPELTRAIIEYAAILEN